MQSPSSYNVTSLVALTVPGLITRVQGYFRGSTADRWLQLHDGTVVADLTGAVPMKSYYLPMTAPFSWDFDPGELVVTKGLVVAVSTTEGTLTLSADTMDCFCDVEPQSIIPEDYSVVGDLSTGVDFVTVWPSSSGPKNLYLVDYTNNDAATRYLQMFANDISITGDVPIMQWEVLAGKTLSLNFGTSGLSPFSQSLSANPINRLGCVLKQSSTSGKLTLTFSTASYIRAYYK
jgi:hypothetical protein